MRGGFRSVMLVRHAETRANVEGRYVGRGDSPFTERGRGQLESLPPVVARFAPEAVYTSPLGRTLATARAMTPTGVALVVMDELTEVDFGPAEGHTFAELEKHGIAVDYSAGRPVVAGGETYDSFERRIDRVLEQVDSGPERLAIVTHGGVFRRLLTRWLDLPVEAGWRFAIPNGAIAVVRLYQGGNVLERLTSVDDEG